MKYAWLMFVGGAILTWGAYVVTIDHGRTTLFGPGKVPGPIAAMRAFLFIGIAYFVMGVVVPLIYLKLNPVDTAKFPNDPGFISKGVVLSTIAGILGAAGALCIVFAVGAARQVGVSPGAVASLVFCFAPIVNVIISLVIEPPEKRPNILFFLGICLAAAGAALVLYYKPEPAKHAKGPAKVPTAAVAQAPVTPADAPPANH
jgi:hypothetical protein